MKYVYLKGTVNKRMDSCISVLLRYARDKAFDRILKLEKGKSTQRINAITKRHHASLQMSTDQVTTVDAATWEVSSSTKPLTYTVRKHDDSCVLNCWLRCRVCSVCVHTFSCTCPDSLLHGTICKHVHLVVRSAGNTQLNPPQPNVQSSGTLLSSVQNKCTIGGTTQIKDRLLLKVSNIAAHITATADRDMLLDVEKHLNSCVNLFKAYQSQKSNEPSNKRILQQRPFYSTKRKRKTAKIRLAKPSFDEKASVTTRLLSSTIPQSSFSKFMTYNTTVHVLLHTHHVGLLTTLCTQAAVNQYVACCTLIDEHGVFPEDSVPTSAIDISEEDLLSIEKHFTKAAYKEIKQSGTDVLYKNPYTSPTQKHFV